jgi:hypothetical protein
MNDATVRESSQPALAPPPPKNHSSVDKPVRHGRDNKVSSCSQKPAHRGQDFKTSEMSHDYQDSSASGSPSRIEIRLSPKDKLFRQLIVSPPPEPEKLHREHSQMFEILTGKQSNLRWSSFSAKSDVKVFDCHCATIRGKEIHHTPKETAQRQCGLIFRYQTDSFFSEPKNKVNDVL